MEKVTSFLVAPFRARGAQLDLRCWRFCRDTGWRADPSDYWARAVLDGMLFPAISIAVHDLTGSKVSFVQ